MRDTYRSIGGFRVPGEQTSDIDIAWFFEFQETCFNEWTNTISVDKSAILFLSAGDCIGEALIMKRILEAKFPGYVLMLDPVEPPNAAERMRQVCTTKGVQSKYFTKANALQNYCASNNITPVLVISLNHSVGLIGPHPEILDPLTDLLNVCDIFRNNRPVLKMVMCYQNSNEGHRILNVPIKVWIDDKRGTVGIMQRSLELQQKRQQEDSDRQMAMELQALNDQELNDYLLALRLSRGE